MVVYKNTEQLSSTHMQNKTSLACSLIHKGSPQDGSAYLIWQIFTPDVPPDANPKGLVPPPGTKLTSFDLLGECVNDYTMEPLTHKQNSKEKNSNLYEFSEK